MLINSQVKLKIKKKVSFFQRRASADILRKKKLRKKRLSSSQRLKKRRVVKRYKAFFLMRFVNKNIYINKHFKNMLALKQSFRYYYGRLRNTQLKKICVFVRQLKARQNKVLTFINLLERRLPMVLLKMDLVPTAVMSLQSILHGRVFVNGVMMTYPNYVVRMGDLVELRLPKSLLRIHKYKMRFRKLKPSYFTTSRFLWAGIYTYAPRFFELRFAPRFKKRAVKYFVDNML